MEKDSNYERKEKTLNDSSREAHVPRNPHKGGKIIREETISLIELLACPLATSRFRHHSCYDLARLFVIHLHNGQVNLVGVSFTLSLTTILEATCIPNVGEQWNKGQYVESIMKRLKAKLKKGLKKEKRA